MDGAEWVWGGAGGGVYSVWLVNLSATSAAA